MSDRDRDTKPPPAVGRPSRTEVPTVGRQGRVEVPRPRGRLGSIRDGDAPPPPLDRDERMFQVIAEMESRIADQIATVRVEAVEEAKRSVRAPAPKSEPPKVTHWLGTIPAIIIAVTGLVAAIAALRREPDTTKDEATYKTLSEAVNKGNAASEERGRIEDSRWRFTIGVFKGQGMKIIDPPGEEPIEPVDIAPPPLNTRKSPSAAPAIQVRTPLPPAAPSAAAAKLPSPEKLFGKTP